MSSNIHSGSNTTSTKLGKITGKTFVEAYAVCDAYDIKGGLSFPAILRFEECDIVIERQKDGMFCLTAAEGDAVIGCDLKPTDVSKCLFWSLIPESKLFSGKIVKEVISRESEQAVHAIFDDQILKIEFAEEYSDAD